MAVSDVGPLNLTLAPLNFSGDPLKVNSALLEQENKNCPSCNCLYFCGCVQRVSEVGKER